MRGAGELTVRVPNGRHHGGRGGGQRRGRRGPRGRGEAALGSARRGGREHVMALASLSLLLSCFSCGRWGVFRWLRLALVGFLSRVVDPGGLVCRFVGVVPVICAISRVSSGLVGAD